MSVLLYSLQTIVLVSAKVYPIVEDRLELCTKPEDRAGKLDYSGLEIVLLSHEEAFLNGTLKFLKQVKSPWKSGVFVERFHRGKWNIEAFNKKNEDFCVSLRNPLEPFYYITSRYISQKCPIPAGYEIKFNMQPLNEMSAEVPRSFIGKWRMTIYGQFDDEGGKKECVRGYFELVDDRD